MSAGIDISQSRQSDNSKGFFLQSGLILSPTRATAATPTPKMFTTPSKTEGLFLTLIEGQTATALCSINIRHVFDLAPDLTTMDDGLVCMSERDLDPQFHAECQPSQRPIALFTSSSWRRWCHKVLVLFLLPISLPGAHSFLLTFPRSDSVKRKCNLRRRRWLHRCLPSKGTNRVYSI